VAKECERRRHARRAAALYPRRGPASCEAALARWQVLTSRRGSNLEGGIAAASVPVLRLANSAFGEGDAEATSWRLGSSCAHYTSPRM
jgi:hypothetical protein